MPELRKALRISFLKLAGFFPRGKPLAGEDVSERLPERQMGVYRVGAKRQPAYKAPVLSGFPDGG